MEIKNCKNCGRIFNYFTGERICPICQKKLDDQFDKVKDYIYEHPGAGIKEVSKECDVSISQIRKWVREERLEFSEDSLVGIECENCGVSIRTGRFCLSCKSKLANDLNSAYKKVDKQEKTQPSGKRGHDHRMRYLK